MGGTAEHVQAKSLIDSMLQLIQRVCGQALGQVVEGAVLIAAVVALAVSFATLGETLHQRGAHAVGADFEPRKEQSLAVAQGEGGFGGFVNPSHI